MGREARNATAKRWDAAFGLQLIGARRRALVEVLRTYRRPTLGNLLEFVGEQMCDLADTPEAGRFRVGDLVDGKAGEGPFVVDLLRSLGIDFEDVEGSVSDLKIDTTVELVTLLETPPPRLAN